MDDSLFMVDGEGFMPTAFAGGPWDPRALHGGPAAALLARAIEAVEPELDMFVSRLTVELMYPVPLASLRLSTEVIRPGRKVQLVKASIEAGGREVARGTALRIRQAEVEVLPQPPARVLPPPQSGTLPWDNAWPGFGGAVEARLVGGSVDDPGPATVWFRLRMPLLPGEEPSPLVRAVAVADFGNGISRVVDFATNIFINPDLTVYLHRRPRGEWIALDASTDPSPNGVGVAQSRLYDRDGPVGTSLQSLLLETRPT